MSTMRSKPPRDYSGRGAPPPGAQPLTPAEEEAKLQRGRRSRMNMDPDEAPKAYIRRHYGATVETTDEIVAFALKNPLTDTHAKLAGYLAFMAGEQMALMGEIRAIELMIKYYTGLPHLNYAGQVGEMDTETTCREIEDIWKALGATEELAKSFAEAARTRDAVPKTSAGQ